MMRWDEERTQKDAPYGSTAPLSPWAWAWADGYNAAIAEYRRQLQDLDGRAS